MVFDYLHPRQKIENNIYATQLIRWLIGRGFIQKDKAIRILDLASGKGYFYFALKNEGYENVFAVDLCPQFKECIKGDLLKKLPFKDGSFDLVISRDVAEHVLDSGKFFDEQNRVLKRGGVIIVMTPNAERMKIGEFYDDYTHVRPYTRKSLLEALHMHGFEKIYVQRLRAVPKLWKYTFRAFDFLFSTRKNNLLGVAKKK